MKMKSSSLISISLLFSLLFHSCSLENRVEVKISSNDTMFIYVRQKVLNDKYKFAIQLDSITEESRCPEGVECIWAGNARAKFNLTEAGNNHQFILNTNTAFGNDTIIGKISYKLINLLPYPSVNNTLQYNSYYAVIVVSKR